MPNESIEFHFTTRPYSVSAGWHADGSFLHYYCNITTPATLSADVLSSIDLDLIVWEDLSSRVEDEDEFEAHRREWGYPEERGAAGPGRAGRTDPARGGAPVPV